ncbi:MAG: aconitase/3-isopropylmalate dehydratase large subunit family protein [Proteobacteria bacterium]|nr:aconitase/3-isopropylmalate dehydratase large subunit family protein [Pseudomonadota bacterium]
MGMTIIEKILSKAGGLDSVVPGDLVAVKVDIACLFDNNFMASVWREVLHVADPSKVVVVIDHRAPAAHVGSAHAHATARSFVEKFGIEHMHDIGFDQGICHVLMAEHGYAKPGGVLLCSDSHTCSAGALNCAARGVGTPDMIYAVTKGETWFRLGETIRYELTGQLPDNAFMKDVFFEIAGEYGAHVSQNVEFGGSALPTLGIDARRTMATMGAELSAEFATFEPDDILINYVKERTDAAFEPQLPDADAKYLDRREINLSKIEPLVALPDSVVNNSAKVGDVAGTKLDQCFVGSCANGTFDDLTSVARVLAGRKVAKGTRFIVTPGSQSIYRRALKAGIIETIMEAGAVVTNSTCGACGGGHMGIVGANDVVITSSTRNFKGRMGDPTAKIYMGSSATVAASAVEGAIADPTPYLS